MESGSWSTGQRYTNTHKVVTRMEMVFLSWWGSCQWFVGRWWRTIWTPPGRSSPFLCRRSAPVTWSDHWRFHQLDTTTTESNLACHQSHDTHPPPPSAGGLLWPRQRRISRSDWLVHHHSHWASERRPRLTGELTQSDVCHVSCGCACRSIQTVRLSVSQVQFDCIHPEKQKKKKSYKNSGVVSVKNCKVEHTLGLQPTITFVVD